MISSTIQFIYPSHPKRSLVRQAGEVWDHTVPFQPSPPGISAALKTLFQWALAAIEYSFGKRNCLSIIFLLKVQHQMFKSGPTQGSEARLPTPSCALQGELSQARGWSKRWEAGRAESSWDQLNACIKADSDVTAKTWKIHGCETDGLH